MKPLHELDNVTMSSSLKEKTLKNMGAKRRRNKNSFFAIVSVAACVVFAFVLQFSMEKPVNEIPVPSTVPYAYVTFDINPSLEFQLDEENKVMDTISYNEDGENVLANLDLRGHEISDAIQTLLTTEEIQAYIEDGFLQVSVYSQDSSRSLMLEQALDASLSKHLAKDQYTCSCASKQEHQEADEHHMSFGRYKIIQQIMELDRSYTLESLESYSMRELNDLYTQLSGEDFGGNHHGGDSNGHHGKNHN